MGEEQRREEGERHLARETPFFSQLSLTPAVKLPSDKRDYPNFMGGGMGVSPDFCVLPVPNLSPHLSPLVIKS